MLISGMQRSPPYSENTRGCTVVMARYVTWIWKGRVEAPVYRVVMKGTLVRRESPTKADNVGASRISWC